MQSVRIQPRMTNGGHPENSKNWVLIVTIWEYHTLQMAIPLPLPRIGINFHAEPIICALQNRTTGRAVGFDARTWRLVLLISGQATVTAPDMSLPITGPGLACLPWTPETRLRVAAGSTGQHVLISEHLLMNAIGRSPESAELRALGDHPATMALTDNATGLADATTCFDLILREAASNQPGREIIIAAQIRMLLVMLWRAATDFGPDSGPVSGPVTSHKQPILRQFRNLVEVHFRNRWPVARYALEIGIPYDRLHDICTNTLGRSPLHLIHERLSYEACLTLERTVLTNDQIAASLGFSTASHFNTFFKKTMGVAPGAYRKSVPLSSTGQPDTTDKRFSDWP